MYVLVDKTQWAITHKHHRRDVLANLAWIECVNRGSVIPLGDPRHFLEFDPTQLRRIYKASTGAEVVGYGYGLAKAVHDMAMRLAETNAEELRVLAQRKKVMDGSKKCYRYNPEAFEPEEMDEDWEAPALKAERLMSEEAAAGKYEAAPHAAPAPSTGASEVFNHTYRPPNAPATGRAPGAPRQSGVREVVFKVADALWEAAGKPTDLKAVLELRKQMMTKLEAEHQVKRTTSSTTLGAWQKERLG
jgi:hypothetical protein